MCVCVTSLNIAVNVNPSGDIATRPLQGEYLEGIFMGYRRNPLFQTGDWIMNLITLAAVKWLHRFTPESSEVIIRNFYRATNVYSSHGLYGRPLAPLT